MRFRSVTGLALSLSLITMMCVVPFGCKKESGSIATTNNNGAPPATAPAAEPPPPPPPPAYKVPDKLPVRATLKLIKEENGAASYKATFDPKFEFDPAKAQLALEINTVGWAWHGRIAFTNKDDDDKAADPDPHELLYDEVTTDKLDLPEERVSIGPMVNQWVKEGAITILIRNESSSGNAPTAPPPKILTVDLIEQQAP